MKSTLSFQDILEHKLKIQVETQSHDILNKPILGADPLHLAFLMGQMDLRKKDSSSNRTSSTKTKAYSKGHSDLRQRVAKPSRESMQRPMISSTQAKAQEKITRIPGPAHNLNPEQKTSYNFFNLYDLNLLPDFTKHELKRAYRLLALKLHPDKGGRTEEFLSLKMHYECLSNLFTL